MSLYIEILRFLDWRTFSIFLIVFIYFLEALDRKRWTPFFNNIAWTKRNVAVSILGLGILFSELILYRPRLPPEATSPIVQFFLFMVGTHFRSFIFYSALIYYLWYKWRQLLPALYAGWFALGVIELSFIPQHWILWHAWMGWEWYLPFIAIMVPFYFERKQYSFNRKTLIFFLAGVFVQYFLYFWRSNGFIVFENGVLVPNLSAISNPTLATWWYEFLPHLLKTFMTLAFTYMEYKPHGQKILQATKPITA